MSPFSHLPCWTIMNCAEDKECPARLNPHKDCWEVFSEVDSTAFNICQDCIVFLSRQEESVLSHQEMEQIMMRKGIDISTMAFSYRGRVDH